MAGDWIKMTHALPEKPEVLTIASKTGLNRFDVVGRLFILWRWFDNNTIDGNAVGVTLVTLDECLFGYSNNVGFVSAVVAVRWLQESPDGVCVVKFDEHISESAKTRAQTAKRVAKSKTKGKANAEANAESVTFTVTETVPREEKRREELFKDVWSAYPSRPGASKADAFKAWSARLKAGVDAELMLAGVQRYAAYCMASGTEPQFIKQPATFFGPGEHYLSDWTFVPPKPAFTPERRQNASDRRADTIAGLTNSGEQHARNDRTIDIYATVIA